MDIIFSPEKRQQLTAILASDSRVEYVDASLLGATVLRWPHAGHFCAAHARLRHELRAFITLILFARQFALTFTILAIATIADARMIYK